MGDVSRRCVVALTLATGCDRVFNIELLPPPADAAPDAYVTPTCFQDRFDDDMIDAARWQTIGDPSTVEEIGGALRISPPANATGYSGLSLSGVDFRGAAVEVRADELPAPSIAEAQLLVRYDDSTFFLVDASSATIKLVAVIDGARSDRQRDRTDEDLFWRIRHDPAADRIVLESRGSNTDWAAHHERSVLGLPLGNATLSLLAGAYTAAPSPGAAVFDDFDLRALPCPEPL